MSATNILLIEDELVTAEYMKTVFENEGYQVSGIAASGEAALSMIRERPPGIIIMDIHLQGRMNGIETAREINKDYNIPIIYVTEEQKKLFFDTAIQTYPLNYLLKPFNDTQLLHAVSVALNYSQRLKNKEVFIGVKDNEYIRLQLDQVLYIKAKGAYTQIFYSDTATTGKVAGKPLSITVSKSSNHVILRLNYASIIKVHRSYFVNIDKIDKYQVGKVFINGTVISVSKTYRAELERRLNLL